MSGYAAPLTDIRFALDAIAGLNEIAALPGCESAASTETVDAILTEAAKFAGSVLAPLNVVGDRERCVPRLRAGADADNPCHAGFACACDDVVRGVFERIQVRMRVYQRSANVVGAVVHPS